MDCVEAIAAGIGFDNCARLLRNQYETGLHIPAEKGERVIVSEVFALSQKGDPLCTVLVENAAEALANLIMNLVRVIDPDTVVLVEALWLTGICTRRFWRNFILRPCVLSATGLSLRN